MRSNTASLIPHSGQFRRLRTTGEKTVTLTVTDNEGNQASATCTITVTLPVADAGDDQNADLNVRVHFNGSRSHDPDGGPLTYLWSFPGSKAGSAIDTDTATPSCTYSTVGIKTVTLTVTDDEGNTDSDTCTVTVFEVVITSYSGL